MIPFIHYWPSLFFSKVSNSRKKVLITPGLYFPNYCVTYLPRDISYDFNKCEHVNLRREWTRAVFEELYYTANNQKIADKKKANYQEGLEKSLADSAARSHDSYMKDPEKSCVRSRESYMKNQENSCADSAARSREGYKNDLEKSRDDSAARSREHRRRNRGGLAGQFPPSILLCFKELTVIKDRYLTDYYCLCNVQYIISRF